VAHKRDPAAGPTVNELTGAVPADWTLQNLLRAVSARLEALEQYRVFEFQAVNDGYAECAAVFRKVAEDERRSLQTLIDCLRAHLAQKSRDVTHQEVRQT
jgi:rubrerythrin